MPKTIQDVTVYDIKAGKPTRGITSTLYNAVNNPLDPYDLVRGLESVGHSQFGTAVPPTLPSSVKTKFSNFPLGSVLSYQQADHSLVIQNRIDLPDFPILPLQNNMLSQFQLPLSHSQTLHLEYLAVNLVQAHELQEATQAQSGSKLWCDLRQKRITASTVGDIFPYTKGKRQPYSGITFS